MSNLTGLLKTLSKMPGVQVKRSPRGHHKVYLGSRMVAVLSVTPSCPHSLKNSLSELRKAGITI